MQTSCSLALDHLICGRQGVATDVAQCDRSYYRPHFIVVNGNSVVTMETVIS